MEHILIIYEDPDIEYTPICYELVEKPDDILLVQFLYNYSRTNQVTIVEAFTVTWSHEILSSGNRDRFSISSKPVKEP